MAPRIPPATPKVGPLATAAFVPELVLAAAWVSVCVGPDEVVVVGATIEKDWLVTDLHLVGGASKPTSRLRHFELLRLRDNSRVCFGTPLEIDLVFRARLSYEVGERVFPLAGLDRIDNGLLAGRGC